MHSQERRSEQDRGADQIGQRPRIDQERRGEDGAENARQASGALGDANVRTLLMGGSQVGEHAEQRRAGKARSDREQRQGSKHDEPGPAFGAHQNPPGKDCRAVDKREHNKAERGKHQADRNELWLAQLFHQPPDRPALDRRANDPAEDEQPGHSGCRGFIFLDIDVEVIADDQRQRALEATEAKGGEEEDNDQQSDLRLSQRMAPLVQVRARRNVLRSRLAAFRQDQKREHKVGGAQSRLPGSSS